MYICINANSSETKGSDWKTKTRFGHLGSKGWYRRQSKSQTCLGDMPTLKSNTAPGEQYNEHKNIKSSRRFRITKYWPNWLNYQRNASSTSRANEEQKFGVKGWVVRQIEG